MPKVKLPLLSGDVRGQFGKMMIYTRGGVVRNYFRPRNPKSQAQEAHRASFKELYMSAFSKAIADLLYAAIDHVHAVSGGTFQRVLDSDLTIEDGASLVLAEYIYVGDHELVLDGDGILEIL